MAPLDCASPYLGSAATELTLPLFRLNSVLRVENRSQFETDPLILDLVPLR